MNHPKPDQWVPYLYGETTGTVRRELRAHLHDCSQCRQEVETWTRNLHRLDSWKLPKAGRPPTSIMVPWFKWAAVTAVVLMAGILIGRATSPKVDVERVRQAIAPEIRRELSAQLAELARDEAARTASLTLVSGRRYTDQVAQQLYVALKRDVDTLALNADAALSHTAQQLFQLADYQEPQAAATAEP